MIRSFRVAAFALAAACAASGVSAATCKVTNGSGDVKAKASLAGAVATSCVNARKPLAKGGLFADGPSMFEKDGWMLADISKASKKRMADGALTFDTLRINKKKSAGRVGLSALEGYEDVAVAVAFKRRGVAMFEIDGSDLDAKLRAKKRAIQSVSLWYRPAPEATGETTASDAEPVSFVSAPGDEAPSQPPVSVNGSGSGSDVSAVPLPAGVLLLLSGVGGLAALRRRKATVA